MGSAIIPLTPDRSARAFMAYHGDGNCSGTLDRDIVCIPIEFTLPPG